MDPTVQAALITGIFGFGLFMANRIAKWGAKGKPTPPEKPKDLEVPEVWQMWLEFKELKNQFSIYKSAASRYFEKLAAAWPGPAEMPEPDEADKEILELTLSRIPKRKSKGNS